VVVESCEGCEEEVERKRSCVMCVGGGWWLLGGWRQGFGVISNVFVCGYIVGGCDQMSFFKVLFLVTNSSRFKTLYIQKTTTEKTRKLV
jgi:hypothetical protein